MNSPIIFFKVGKDGRLIAPPGMSKEEAAAHRQSARAWEHYHRNGRRRRSCARQASFHLRLANKSAPPACRPALGDVHLPKTAHGEVDEDDRDHGGPDQRGGKLDGAG